MQIARADASDIDALTRVEIESKRASIPEILDPVQIDFTNRKLRWERYFRGVSPVGSKPPRIVLKVILTGNVVGFIAGHLTTRYGMDAEIQSFYVLREHQRNGIGSALLAELADWLIQAGAYKLCVGIASENPYRVFYSRHGAHYLNDHWMFWDDIHSLVAAKAEPR